MTWQSWSLEPDCQCNSESLRPGQLEDRLLKLIRVSQWPNLSRSLGVAESDGSSLFPCVTVTVTVKLSEPPGPLGQLGNLLKTRPALAVNPAWQARASDSVPR